MEQRGLQEMFLPLAIVSIVGMMILPLPSAVLDVLLAANISFSLMLLLTAIYSKDAEKFTTLPSLLLLTTIFRLALNVSTTRQLLTFGEAPQVVSAFGEFVVGGNVLVGLVVFLIVTLVQFIVVSKGAERVAEVAARFTLDAMPGKQMAIDADIRAGILSLGEAKERRRELQRESKLFGALDGAMKFIKGDAIAGLCIAVLNIGAGFILGIYQMGLSATEALDRYTIFTIGDSLVSQIPALLVSVAAGIAVTRVGESDGSTMAGELIAQLTGEPRVLLSTALILGALALSPGLPTATFLLLAFVVLLGAMRRAQQQRAAGRNEAQQEFQPRALSNLLLTVGLRARELLLAEGILTSKITAVRKAIYDELGVIIPEPEWELSAGIPALSVNLTLDGIALCSNCVEEGNRSSQEGDVSRQVGELFSEACRGHIQDFIDDTQTRTLLDLHMATAEDLIASIVPKQISVTTLTRLLRDLLAEGVSIRNLRSILQGVAEFVIGEGAIESPLGERRYLVLLAAVRVAFQRQLMKSISRQGEEFQVWELAPRVDRLLSQSVLNATPLSPQFVEAMMQALGELDSKREGTIVLASMLARRTVFQVARSCGKQITVLSPEEIPEETRVRIVGQLMVPIEIGEEPLPLQRKAA